MVDHARWHTWKDMPTPLMKYAITKTWKGGADDWIAYPISCKIDPKTIVYMMMKLRWNLRWDSPP